MELKELKYSMDLSSTDPKDWKLLRLGEPAGTQLDKPGSFDNAHLEFWQALVELIEEVNRLRGVVSKAYLEAKIYDGILEMDKIASVLEAGLKKGGHYE